MKFKNNDIVICVNAKGENDFILDGIYTIAKTYQGDDGGNNYVAIKEISQIAGWDESRFELVSKISIFDEDLFTL